MKEQCNERDGKSVPTRHRWPGAFPIAARSQWPASSLPSRRSSRFSWLLIFSMLGKSLTGPTPREVLETPIFYSICLLSSSLTIHFAAKSLARDRVGAFLGLWALTIVLGGTFMYGTAQEWHRLIYEHGLTISTNLFGTTYYSLVGLHAFHVTAGLIMLLIVAIFALAGRVRAQQSRRVEVLAMYWHFVDAVWVVVFTVVYVLGR